MVTLSNSFNKWNWRSKLSKYSSSIFNRYIWRVNRVEKTSIFFTAINIWFSIGILLGDIVTSWMIIYMTELVMGLCFIIILYYNNPKLLSNSDSDSHDNDDVSS